MVPSGLRRFHQTGQIHFVTFTCYRRQPRFEQEAVYELFLLCLEDMRMRFDLRIFGYVVMLEHFHILLSEPQRGSLAAAIHYLKLAFSKRRRRRPSGAFWQKRYHDRNVRDGKEFSVKLRYLHRNPVKRGLVPEPDHWKWSSFRHYFYRETGIVEIESEWTARDRETREKGGPERVFLGPK